MSGTPPGTKGFPTFRGLPPPRVRSGVPSLLRSPVAGFPFRRMGGIAGFARSPDGEPPVKIEEPSVVQPYSRDEPDAGDGEGLSALGDGAGPVPIVAPIITEGIPAEAGMTVSEFLPNPSVVPCGNPATGVTCASPICIVAVM